MSDSFADLWSSTTTTSKKPTLASASRNNTSTTPTPPPPKYTNPTYGKPDLFALLSSPQTSGSSTPRYGAGSPALGAGSGRSTPAMSGVQRSGSGASGTSVNAPTTIGGRGDAFGDLFSGTTTAGTNGTKNMTLAARLALERQQPQQLVGGGRVNGGTGAVKGGNNEVWVGLDRLGGLGGVVGNGKGPSINKTNQDDDWGLGDFVSGGTSRVGGSAIAQPSQPQAVRAKSTTLWDLDEFASSSSSKTPSLVPSSLTSRSSSSISAASNIKSKPEPSTKLREPEHLDNPDEDFDFGGREDQVQSSSSHSHSRNQRSRGKGGLLDLDDLGDHEARDGLLGDEDEFGVLGRGDERGTQAPIYLQEEDDDILGMLSKPVEVVRASRREKTPPRDINPAASASTRPHRVPRPLSPPPHILGQIVEMGFSVAQARTALATTKDGIDVQAALESLLNGGEREHHPPPPRRPDPPTREEPSTTTRRGAPKGQKERQREREERLRAQRENPGDSVAEIQEQADKLLSQASEIGLSVFTKATAFWKEGKEKVAKVYEERTAESTRGRVDGRPKWMQEVAEDSFQSPVDKQKNPVREPFPEVDGRPKWMQDVAEPPLDKQKASVREPSPEVDLFSSPSSSTRKPALTPQPTQPRHSRTRNLPTASSTILSAALAHKTVGTDAFKLGQYAAAVDSYSLAIDILPSGHLLLLPLYTNRALARLKTGEYNPAAEDCSKALGVITAGEASWSPTSEEPHVLSKGNDGGWAHPQGLGVDLCDHYVKALKRRAEASEGREKWQDAVKDWGALAGLNVEWVGERTRGEAVRGAGRCRRMVEGPVVTTTPVAKPRPKPKPASSSSTPSLALTALQSQNAQAEADLTLQYSLKDSVDGRLSAWRKGKENNIRALLASLDAVLWEEVLRGVKIGGMAELVTQAQVKKAYVRAIGRVHPDKLNASNSTVEQRMLANGVFGTLNEAWIAFQASQK